MNKNNQLREILKDHTVLYVEDEHTIRNEMTQILQLLCKEVIPVSNAADAYTYYSTKNPNIILSDISLGGDSGIDLSKKIRFENKHIPIILLSAHTDTAYLLEAAKLKLVAYLTKPINFEELQQTLFDAVQEQLENETLINNETLKNNLFYLNEKVSFDMDHKTLIVNNKQKKLSSYESRLLEYFIKNKKRTISPDEIKNHVWDDPYDATDTAFKSLIYKLRAKIGKDTIQNLSGIGYYLNIE